MTNPSVAIVILAAGESARMGLPKQLLPMRGKNLLRHTVEQAAASKAREVYVVLGFEFERIRNKLPDGRHKVVVNLQWTEGMSSSMRAGISALPETVDAAIIALCDQPFLSSRIFDSLIDAFVSSGKPIIASEFDRTACALFSEVFFGTHFSSG